jgi:hypothetical protein
MPRGLDSADRKLLIAAGVLLIVVAIASALVSPPKSDQRSGYPSSYSSSWDGAKAAYEVLQASGYQIERWESEPGELKGDATHEVLILADPWQFATSDDRNAIQEFLERGGRVVATGSMAASLLPRAKRFVAGGRLEDKTTFKPLAPSPLMAGVETITMIAPKGWAPESPSQLVVFGDGNTAAVVSYREGNGEVVWWGSSSPLTNGSIKDAGNLALLLNSVGPREGTRVLWDEYFHGARGSWVSYFDQTPLPWGVWQITIVFLAILLTFSRRSGPVRMPAKVSRLSPLEFVETLGDLYAAGHAGTAAVRIAYQRLRFLLTRQLGLASDVPAAALARSTNEALGWKQGPLLETLSRADRASRETKLSDADSLKLVQEIFDYTARLELRRPGTEER